MARVNHFWRRPHGDVAAGHAADTIFACSGDDDAVTPRYNCVGQ